MEQAGDETQARFATVAAALGDQPNVRRTDMHASLEYSVLLIDQKTFAIFWTRRFLVKLPAQRLEALEAAGAGRRFGSPEHGPRPGGWLEVDADDGPDWLLLAREALEFVGT